MGDKVITGEAAAAVIGDGVTVAITGSGGGLLEADKVFAAIEARFLATGHPRGLTLVHALGIGDAKGRGVGRFAHEGVVRRVIGGHWSWAPEMQALARAEAIEAYTLPAGIISTLFREIGAGRPGVITPIGLGTFADPRHGGGKVNASATEDLVEHVVFDGADYLRYKPFPIDVGIVCGSTSDARGTISAMHEPADLDAYAVALAAHNSGGSVIAQVREISEGRSSSARLATIPGVLVDHVVVHEGQWQSYAGAYDPAMSGESPSGGASSPDLPDGIRRIIASRAAAELTPGASVNYGYGIPGGIPGLIAGRTDLDLWSTVEQGSHNGEIIDGPLFGATRQPQAIVGSPDQFDFYSGGGLDIAFLGMGEMDAAGNVNVSWLGDSVVGPGGFVDITQNARKVVFCGTFEAKGLRVAVDDGALVIDRAGEVPKLVETVRHVTFSGARARADGQEVLYVTERAVFRLTPEGVALVEAAEGVDIQRDVLDRMQFAPLVGDIARVPVKTEASR
jgi:acyl CoA:acetate/3-ketoacid CoA transferase